MISVWADDAIAHPDSSFDTHLRRPREAMADRVWGGPRRGTVADLFARADAIGSPPRVPEHALPGTLTGTPYGTSPAWGNLPNTYDKVFDGDPSTFFDFAEPSGGYAGIDLGAGHASPVAAIRFVPRNGQLARMVGGRFEGCTDGPDSGCRTLATVEDDPVLGWNELAVADTGRYRWLRYVGPDGTFCDVAEVEFVAPARDVTVEAPARLRQLDDNRVVTSYRNTSSRPVYDVRLDLGAYAVADRAARAVQASGPARFAVVPPGKTVSVPWQVDVPLPAATGAYDLVGRASYQQQPGAGQALEHASGFDRSTLDPALSTSFDARLRRSRGGRLRRHQAADHQPRRARGHGRMDLQPTLRRPTPASRSRRRRARYASPPEAPRRPRSPRPPPTTPAAPARVRRESTSPPAPPVSPRPGPAHSSSRSSGTPAPHRR